MRYLRLLPMMFALVVMACSHDNDHEGHEHAHGHEHDHAAETAHNHAAEVDHEHEAEAHTPGEITLDIHAQEMFGIESQVINPGDFAEVIVVSGEIAPAPQSDGVVAAPSSGIVQIASVLQSGREVAKGATLATINSSAVAGGNANAQAQAALEAAKRELDRVTPLREEGIVSERAYNEALAAYQQAQAAFSNRAASGRAIAPISGVISQVLVREGEYVEAGAPIATISGNVNLTLQANVPERYASLLPQITTANIQLSNSPKIISLAALKGRRLQSFADASKRRGYLPVYFSLVNNGSIIPGAMAKVYLIGAQRHNVLSVPVSALSEQQGQYFVYKRLDEDCFAKLPVEIGASDGERVEVLSGLEPSTDIVVSGVRAVRLAESATVAPEGHSHNH